MSCDYIVMYTSVVIQLNVVKGKICVFSDYSKSVPGSFMQLIHWTFVPPTLSTLNHAKSKKMLMIREV